MQQRMLMAVLFLAVGGPVGSQALGEVQRRIDSQEAYRQGERSMQQEAFEAAAGYFRTAAALDPLMWLAHYGLGQSQMALKRYPEAVQAYLGCREALERIALLDTTDRGTLDREREEEMRELRDALTRIRSIKDAGTQNRIQLRLEERLRALEGLRQRGGSQRPSIPAEVSMALGSAHFRAGQLAEAERAYSQAVEADSKFGAAHNNLAALYMMTGRLGEAREAIRRAEKAGFKVDPRFKQDLEERVNESPR